MQLAFKKNLWKSAGLFYPTLGVGFLCLGIFVSCSPSDTESERTSPIDTRIVCTFQPLYVMAANVVGSASGISLECLLSPEAGCPHDYAVTPSDVSKLEKADILIVNGLGLDDFAVNAAQKVNPSIKIIIASENISPIPIQEETGEPEDEHGHHHGALNPHAWVSPRQAITMVQTLASLLGEMDPERKISYQENAEVYARKIDELFNRLFRIIQKASNRKIVTFHAIFDYLAQDTGLVIVASIEVEPGHEPSATRMAQLIETIKTEKPAAIFSEPQYPARAAEMLARETGVPLYSLDSTASGLLDPNAYLDAMEHNLETLRLALGEKR